MALLLAFSHIDVAPSSSVTDDGNGPAPSPFAVVADALIAAGQHAIPLAPHDKYPAEYVGGRWIGFTGWTRYSLIQPTPAEIELWKTWPDANVGIVMGTPHGDFELGALDFDTDDEGELEKLQGVFPWSNCRKRGARGYTGLYLLPAGTRTRGFKVLDPTPDKPNNTRMVLEILTGNAPRQTVMPPSLHPHGMQYRYVGSDRVVPIGDLRVVTRANLEALEGVMRDLGWDDPGEVAVGAGDGAGALGGDLRDLNELALTNFDRWVPALGLFNWKRSGAGKHATVASWRPSGTGRPLEQRKRNLSFHRDGIKDFGDGPKGYTAIDVVMAAWGLGVGDAAHWLKGQLGLLLDADTLVMAKAAPIARDDDSTLYDSETGEVAGEVPVEPLPLRTLADSTSVAHDATSGSLVASTNDNDSARTTGREGLTRTTAPVALALVMERHGEPSPFPEPFWFIKGLVPTGGTFLLAGISTAGKTFVAISLAVALATGAPFMGLPIRQTCGSIIVVGEGRATIRKRLAAAIDGVGGAEDGERLPISFFEGSLKQPARAATVAALKAEKARMEETLGIDLGVIFVDTLAACFEFEDENSSSEATRSMNVLRDIGRELGCLVIATAHHGKNEAGGVRGSSAFTASADDILTVIVKKDDDDIVIQRQVRVAKTRDGEIGRLFTFELVPIVIGVDRDEEDIVSAYVRATEEGVIVHRRRDTLPGSARTYLAALSVKQGEAVSIMPFGIEGPAIKGVPREVIRCEFYASYPADGDTEAKRQETKRKAFNKGEATLVAKNKIVTRELGPTTYAWLVSEN